jgi:hypothetical protein
MDLYDSQGGGEAYAAYINIGGGSASIGGTEGKQFYRPGVHGSMPASTFVPDCVATRMLSNGVPVIHVSDARGIAERYEFAIAPASRPAVGEGNIYGGPQYRVWLVLAVMVVIWSVLVLMIAPGRWQQCKRIWGRLNKRPSPPSDATLPANVEWMV